MDNASGHTINLANSIIGVSILAMPYCFRQCGVLLSIFLLLISSVISRLACHFLLKSAIIARRKTFEFLAFHIFGSLGKFSIEIGMIGFLLGTCIAFFVVMGDLGPAILSEMTGVHIGSALRNSTLIALAVFCVLPLGLLRNVDSLNGVSTATIGFYCCLVLKIVIEALPHIFTGDWVSEVILWRPAGILQCLPIFSMALFCQTQLFEIYQAIPNASLEKMNGMVRVAVNMCTCVYIFVGAFGYIAFFQKPFTGNILLSFTPSITSDVIKMGFVLSLAFSFPLVIFPCRASLYSLLYKWASYTTLHEGGATNYIPEGRFKMLTLIIVSISLTIGIMIPSIELVLGLIGSTIGVMICVLFPVTCFICISPKNTNERILAQIMLFVGVIVMVLGTYANLQAIDEVHLVVVTEKVPIAPEISFKHNVPEPEKPAVMDIPTTVKAAALEEKKQKPPDEIALPDQPVDEKKKEESAKEVRHEPPQPEEPVDNPVPPRTEKNEEKSEVKQPEDKQDEQGPVEEPVKPNYVKIEAKPEAKLVEGKEDKQGPVVEPVQPADEKIEEQHQKEEAQKMIKEAIVEKKPVETKPEVKEAKPVKKNEEVDIEAIKKEDTELKEQEDKREKDRDQLLIDTIQKQHEVQKEIVEQQKKLIEVIQKQQESVNKKDVDIVNEEKVKAVKQIEDIAKRAIESIRAGEVNEEKAENQGEEVVQDKKEVKNEQDKVQADAEERNEGGNLQNNVDAFEERPKQEMNAREETALKDGQNKEEKSADDKSKIVEVKLENSIVQELYADKSESSKIKMVPLPIALAKLNNVTIETKGVEATITKTKASNGEDPEVKAMRRDILSEDDPAKTRSKREIRKSKIANLNKAVKEVCEEISKSTSTEKPLIKMLCKLSEPSLVERVDLAVLEKKNFAKVDLEKNDLDELFVKK